LHDSLTDLSRFAGLVRSARHVRRFPLSTNPTVPGSDDVSQFERVEKLEVDPWPDICEAKMSSLRIQLQRYKRYKSRTGGGPNGF
jgi:hypothetical protein